MRNHELENSFLPQPEARKLIVDDGIDCDGSLAQPVGNLLLSRFEVFEAFRLDLEKSSSAGPVHQGLVLLSAGEGAERAEKCESAPHAFSLKRNGRAPTNSPHSELRPLGSAHGPAAHSR